MRLIDADALFNWGKHKLSDAVKYGNKDEEHQDFSYSTLMMYEIADEVDDAPTISAAPVVRGEWIEDGDMQICSNCGEEHSWEEYRASYCEDCGAKMEDKP